MVGPSPSIYNTYSPQVVSPSYADPFGGYSSYPAFRSPTSYTADPSLTWGSSEPTMLDALKALADAFTTGDTSVITGRAAVSVDAWNETAAAFGVTAPEYSAPLGAASVETPTFTPQAPIAQPVISQPVFAAPAPVAPVVTPVTPAPLEAAITGAAEVAPNVSLSVAQPAVTAVAVPVVAPAASLALRGTAVTNRTARRVGNQFWAGRNNPQKIHVTQVKSKYNASPALGNRDCGPASVVMALAMLGKTLPGVKAAAPAQVRINRARALSGAGGAGAETTNIDLERVLARAGAQTQEIADPDSIRRAVLSGKPVILNGNPRHAGAYGFSFGPNKLVPYNGAHWIVVTGMTNGKFIINDPLSKVGALTVTRAQLEAYRGGSLGIAVA